MTNIKQELRLFLIPVSLSDVDLSWVLTPNVHKIIHSLKAYIAENAKTARHFLKQAEHPLPISEIEILELDKHQPDQQNKALLDFMQKYKEVGLMSEAGMPCIADPGNKVVRLAHENDILVKPLTGPSSILLALTASGMNGQSFKFSGYLPQKPAERQAAILKCEKESSESTQLFIEAPYRNDQMLKDLCRILKPNTYLMLAIHLTAEDEKIISRKISWWKQQQLEIGKVPCLFGIGQ